MIVDINVHLGRWPTRRLPHDQTHELVAMLAKNDVEQAWAGSFDGLLHKDIAAVNARVARECQELGQGRLLPVATIDPALPGWEGDLEQSTNEFAMRVVRLYPNYHDYKLDTPEFERFLAAASERNLVVQIVVRMEDTRTQHRLLQVPDVDIEPLPTVIEKLPESRIVLLNAGRTMGTDAAAELAASGRVWFDIATVEGVGGLENLLEKYPPERLLFGSHAPFFIFEATRLKFRESQLGAKIERAIMRENALELLT